MQLYYFHSSLIGVVAAVSVTCQQNLVPLQLKEWSEEP